MEELRLCRKMPSDLLEEKFKGLTKLRDQSLLETVSAQFYWNVEVPSSLVCGECGEKWCPFIQALIRHELDYVMLHTGDAPHTETGFAIPIFPTYGMYLAANITPAEVNPKSGLRNARHLWVALDNWNKNLEQHEHNLAVLTSEHREVPRVEASEWMGAFANIGTLYNHEGLIAARNLVIDLLKSYGPFIDPGSCWSKAHRSGGNHHRLNNLTENGETRSEYWPNAFCRLMTGNCLFCWMKLRDWQADNDVPDHPNPRPRRFS